MIITAPSRRLLLATLLLLAAGCAGKGAITSVPTGPYLPVGTNTTLASLTNTQLFNTATALLQFDQATGVNGASQHDLGSTTQVTILALGPTDGDFRLQVTDNIPAAIHVFVDQTFVHATDADPVAYAGGFTPGDFHLQKGGINFTYASPLNTGNTYSAYGFWYQTGTSTPIASAFALGLPNPVMPTSGTGTYAGVSSGLFLDTAGGGCVACYYYSSTVAATVDFAAGTVTSFATTGSQKQLLGGGPKVADASLDIAMTGAAVSYTGSSFTLPTVSNAGATMTGAVKGTFFRGATSAGPGVFYPEMAGTVLLFSGDFSKSQVGGFAARRTSP